MTRANGRDQADFASGYALGYECGVDVGYRRAEDDLQRAWTVVAEQVRTRAATPTQAELERLRTPDHLPCSARCRRCSRCIHSLSYWDRGGRPYLGVDGELEYEREHAA